MLGAGAECSAVGAWAGVQGCDIRRALGWRKYNCVTRGFDLVERFGPFSFRLQYPYLADSSGGAQKEKAISKRLDSILKNKEALDKKCAEYVKKGGAAYLAKKKEELAAMQSPADVQ